MEAFEEAEDTAKLVKDALEKEHAKRQEKTPKGPVTSFKVGGHDWVEGSWPLDTHRTKTWYTPGKIAKRVGPNTFLVQTGPSQFETRHETQLEDAVPDITGKHVDFQYTQHEDVPDEDEYLKEDDYVVDKVLSHRPNPAVPGGIEFKVKWKGCGKSHDSWVPPSSFVPPINKVWQAYLGQRGVDISAKDLMAAIMQAEDKILSLTDPFEDACCTMGG